jgi:hypothetical protein
LVTLEDHTCLTGFCLKLTQGSLEAHAD